jgi:hypothetical protein
MIQRFLAGLFTLGLTSLLLAQTPPPTPQLNEEPISDKDRAHWSFQPIRRPTLPQVKQASQIRTPVDLFILRDLEAKGFSSAPPAPREILLKRLTFDLTGLLPTPEEVAAFVRDDSPDAYERVVHRLLSSPHFGERQAQHWLDLVRFAESNGYEVDGDRPSAWRYRDYVVRSFNSDKRFDQFVREQVAGDELAKGNSPREVADWWIATGFHRCGPQHVVSGNIDQEVNRQEILTEMVQGIGSSFLGLTLTCARCHDHKFDPISQADYYRLEAFFASTKGKEIDFAIPDERTAQMKLLLDLQIELRPIREQIKNLDAPYEQRLKQAKQEKLELRYQNALNKKPNERNPEEQRLVKEAGTLTKVTWDEILDAMSDEDLELRKSLRAKQHALEAKLPLPPSQAWAVANESTTPATHILKRGEVKRKGAIVSMGMPRVLNEKTPLAKSRLDLANWLVSPDHPLTARVFVNRVWQNYFGRGLVGTPNDFGLQGEKPTHPELLDFLADEFIRSGWQVKHLHKMIVLSATYRQSSDPRSNPTASQSDPENRLLGRMNRKRLEGETVRDQLLQVSGMLNRQLEGQSVRIPLEPEVYDLIFTEGEPDGLWPVTPDVQQHFRRTIYLFAKRNVRLPILEAFDQPDRISPCGNRVRSTFAPQALILMNGPLSLEMSKRVAGRLLSEAGNSREGLIRRAYQLALLRSPTRIEMELTSEFLHQQKEEISARLLARRPVNFPDPLPEGIDLAEAIAVVDLALALFNLNEFVHVN